MHCTGTALGDAATELGAVESGLFTYDPQERCVRVNIQLVSLAINVQCDHSKISIGSRDRALAFTLLDGLDRGNRIGVFDPVAQFHRNRVKMTSRSNQEAAHLAEKNAKQRARHYHYWRLYDQYDLLGDAVDGVRHFQAADSSHGFSQADDALDHGDGRKLGEL
jgi:hypothetical protein